MPDVSLKGVSCLRGDVVDVRSLSYCKQGQGKVTILLFYSEDWADQDRSLIQVSRNQSLYRQRRRLCFSMLHNSAIWGPLWVIEVSTESWGISKATAFHVLHIYTEPTRMSNNCRHCNTKIFTLSQQVVRFNHDPLVKRLFSNFLR